MDDLKKQVESILFSVGRKIELVELAKLVKGNQDNVLRVLEELKGEYEARSGSLMVVQDGTAWKLAVREAYLGTVRKIVTQTELPKSVMETLAVIAYKNPVMQSHIIKVRTNKAYDHLALLEQDGFLTRVKHGRTKLIRLAPKFFDYFDIPEDQLKEKFKNVLAIEKAIEEKESDMAQRNHELTAHQEQMKQADDAHKKKTAEEHVKLDAELAKMPPIELLDEEGEAHKLSTYPTTPIPDEPKRSGPQIEVDTMNGMETYGEEPVEPSPMPDTQKKKAKKETQAPAEPALTAPIPTQQPAAPTEAPEDAVITQAREEAKQETIEEAETPAITEEEIEKIAKNIAAGKESAREFKGKGMFAQGITEDVQKRIDERVEELVHGKHEEKE
ncbi:SMC-Scp complex subunit ScpB [Candidatus Woesearchaeota archaeon]|nr:SMC-Scp complex subunit ScpB [Candidatus Woesearchaeota archaeon]